MPAAQLLKTPPLYCDQLLASTVIESGLCVIPSDIPAQPEADKTWLILNSPPFFEQVLVWAAYGYDDSVVSPLALT